MPSQAPGSAQGFAYSYDDTTGQPGETFWYWLEDVELNGAATLHGPVSATMQTPTAVTLATFGAASGGLSTAALAWIVLLALLVASRLLMSWRRSRQPADREVD